MKNSECDLRGRENLLWQVVITEAETQPGSWLTASGLVKCNLESLNDQVIGTRVSCRQRDTTIGIGTPGQPSGTNTEKDQPQTPASTVLMISDVYNQTLT